MELNFKITIEDVNDNISNEKISEVLRNIKARLTGYGTDTTRGY